LFNARSFFIHDKAFFRFIVQNRNEMIAVQVTYKVKADFFEENKSNISAFLADFKAMHTSKFLYHVYVKEDGLTFVHVSMYENSEIQQQILNTPSFLAFQKQRDESGLIAAPVVEILKHLGSSLSLLK
jgi:quinol monooxygenase YgiN